LIWASLARLHLVPVSNVAEIRDRYSQNTAL
jgi:hypothetical protein